jgi:monoamine oxidase
MRAAISAVPYSESIKVGLQFKRRFWEEDEEIYGGITFTDLPIRMISYPSNGLHSRGKAVLLGAYAGGTYGIEFTALEPGERVKRTLEYGARIHPQYREEFESGVSVAWLRVPGAMGCFGLWSDTARAQHYKNLCAFDGRYCDSPANTFRTSMLGRRVRFCLRSMLLRACTGASLRVKQCVCAADWMLPI